jgi:hypothetical protein
MSVIRKYRKKTKQHPVLSLEHAQSIKELMQIPGVGVSIANDLWNIDIKSVAELKGKDPEKIYERSNKYAGAVQDRCLLYVFRCAVYFAETSPAQRDPQKLKWWNWKINIP